MKKHIPNFITLLNLCSGVMAIWIAMHNELKLAAIMVIVAAVFDFFDGFSARLLHVKTNIGKELDSLSDIVSFGVAPAIIVSQLYAKIYGFSIDNLELNIIILCFPIIYVCCASLRLAKFNLDSEQTEHFKGLPTPAAAFVLISLPFFEMNKYAPIIFSGTLLLLSVLMVSKLHLFSLKFQNLKLKDNLFRYILIIIGGILLCVLFLKAIPFIILIYILLSIVENQYSKKFNVKKT